MAIAGMMQQMKGGDIQEDMARHIILSMIQKINKDFKDDYGTLVMAMDGRKYWRKEIYPYYKANRSKGRDKSNIDWPKIFEISDKLKAEVREHFPYITIEIERAEADDIIGSFARHYGVEFGHGEEPVLIVAKDGDFNQLLRYTNVRQYDPQKKVFCKYDKEGLIDKIISGDGGDGIPNIRSDDDTFITEGKRQPPITKKIREEVKGLYYSGKVLESPYGRNWARNNQLINLDHTPDVIYNEVIERYQQGPLVQDRSRIFDYLASNRLKFLMDRIQDF